LLSLNKRINHRGRSLVNPLPWGIVYI